METYYFDNIIKNDITKFNILINKVISKLNLNSNISNILINKIYDEIISNVKYNDYIWYIKLESILKPCKNIIDIFESNDYIVTQLSYYISIIFDNSSYIRIGDVGGGNGNLLNNISKKLKIKKKNLYCIETDKWVETYKFDKKINYIFWNNQIVNMSSNSIHVFMCIVSLHHMNDYVINNLFNEINRILISGGILIIKEHDCNSINNLSLINWEHHLYHILNTNNLTKDEIINYLDHETNYKSFDTWNILLSKYNFSLLYKLDRRLEVNDDCFIDDKNITNLYWSFYKLNK